MSFGRLESSQGSKPMSDINMTPLIDVMLVLLVIFMVAAPLLVSTVQVDLPKAATRTADAPRFVELRISREGQVYVEDAVQDSETLKHLLEKTAQANADAEVRLRADTNVPYGRVVEVMGTAQKAGLSRMGFVADAPESAKP